MPDDWKEANVAPIFKKGDKHKPSNYRPVSLTCITSKIMEHIIVSNLMKHLEISKSEHSISSLAWFSAKSFLRITASSPLSGPGQLYNSNRHAYYGL